MDTHIRHFPESTIPIPQSLHVQTFVLPSQREGCWEKSLVLAFPHPRLTLSTSDGLVLAAAVVNHSAQAELWDSVGQQLTRDGVNGGKVYLETVRRRVAEGLGLTAAAITQMATAVDVGKGVVVTREQAPLIVSVVVTAGVETNAVRAGTDLSSYVEGQEPAGTINVILLTNAQLSVGAMARAIVTVTEAKTAALQDLAVPSSYTPQVQATGTGTDSVIVVSGTDGPPTTYTGGHSLIGAMIGQAVHAAVSEALQQQACALAAGIDVQAAAASRTR